MYKKIPEQHSTSTGTFSITSTGNTSEHRASTVHAKERAIYIQQEYVNVESLSYIVEL